MPCEMHSTAAVLSSDRVHFLTKRINVFGPALSITHKPKFNRVQHILIKILSDSACPSIFSSRHSAFVLLISWTVVSLFFCCIFTLCANRIRYRCCRIKTKNDASANCLWPSGPFKPAATFCASSSFVAPFLSLLIGS